MYLLIAMFILMSSVGYSVYHQVKKRKVTLASEIETLKGKARLLLSRVQKLGDKYHVTERVETIRRRIEVLSRQAVSTEFDELEARIREWRALCEVMEQSVNEPEISGLKRIVYDPIAGSVLSENIFETVIHITTKNGNRMFIEVNAETARHYKEEGPKAFIQKNNMIFDTEVCRCGVNGSAQLMLLKNFYETCYDENGYLIDLSWEPSGKDNRNSGLR
ncbi:hypothetical protein [Candidatus Magnetobacterium casense]|uniref:Uncharacterized protein n=1 Tax=Candidatus Magnetobacterium casense TaxID=1455061 RepID=A0ABS6RTX6_9BACT|nr:hypothetical protein [Candidatus Magnetobacterium casensis]MBV6340085.1 hypothetical protein [Candidatus Magnetobacterium casensis]